jgi:hypothetical protein
MSTPPKIQPPHKRIQRLAYDCWEASQGKIEQPPEFLARNPFVSRWKDVKFCDHYFDEHNQRHYIPANWELRILHDE